MRGNNLKRHIKNKHGNTENHDETKIFQPLNPHEDLSNEQESLNGDAFDPSDCTRKLMFEL